VNSVWAVTNDVSQVHKNTSTDKNPYWAFDSYHVMFSLVYGHVVFSCVFPLVHCVDYFQVCLMLLLISPCGYI